MKSILATLSSIALLTTTGSAATVFLDNTAGGLGEALDALGFTVADSDEVVAVPGISGLMITVHAITTDGATTGNLNATGTALGINGSTDDETARFEADFNQSVTFSFNKAVSITQLDFTHFSAGEAFNFGGTSIANGDLSNGSTDVYDFSTPLEIAANTQFTLQATAGDIGIEAMTLTVVPEPNSTALLGLGGLALIMRRRK